VYGGLLEPQLYINHLRNVYYFFIKLDIFKYYYDNYFITINSLPKLKYGKCYYIRGVFLFSRNLFVNILYKLKSYFIKRIERFRGKKNIGIYHGDDFLFKEALIDSKVYGEYGCGSSTIYVSNNYNIKIISVDTSIEWINNVNRQINDDNSQIDLKFIDVGETKEWGYPKDYSKRSNFINYVKSIWSSEDEPDVVLIDGRFRIACFLYCLIAAKPNTKIIFDDYNRQEYHIVEEYLKPTSIKFDQALFIVNKSLEKEEITKELNRFLYVMS